MVQKSKVLRSLKRTINRDRVLKYRLRSLYRTNEKSLSIDLCKQGRTISKAITNYTASHTLNKNLNLREENVKQFLKSIRDICKFDMDEAIKERCHSVHTEPYFYETSYLDRNRQFLSHIVELCKVEHVHSVQPEPFHYWPSHC